MSNSNENPVLNQEELAILAALKPSTQSQEVKPVESKIDNIERAILGGILQSEPFARKTLEIVAPEMFICEAWGIISRTVYAHLRQYGKIPDRQIRDRLISEALASLKNDDTKKYYWQLYNVALDDCWHVVEPDFLLDRAKQIRREYEFKKAYTKHTDLARQGKIDLHALIADLQQAATATQVSKRRPYTITQAAEIVPPAWHIKGIFPSDSFVVLWGQSGSGKSFLALDWALSTASGIDWMGHETRQGRVVYVAAEGAAGIRKRCLRWLDYHQLPEPEQFALIPDAYNLVDQAETAELISTIDQYGKEPPALVVIDTLNRNMAGSESDDGDMAAFIKSCTTVQKHYNCAVIVIHHTGWNTERERGHSSLRAAADTMISTDRMGDKLTDGIKVTCRKQKDFDPFDDFVINSKVIGPTPDESSVVLTAKHDLTDQLAAQRQHEEDSKIAVVIKHLSDDPYQTLTLTELTELAPVKGRACRNWIDRAVNCQYVIRTGQGTKGEPHRYYLTPSGKDVVNKYAGLSLIGESLDE